MITLKKMKFFDLKPQQYLSYDQCFQENKSVDFDKFFEISGKNDDIFRRNVNLLRTRDQIFFGAWLILLGIANILLIFC